MAHVLHHATADSSDIDNLIDCYCGSGLFAIAGSKSFVNVVGIEVSEVAVKAARANAVLNGCSNVAFHAGTAEEIFGANVKHLPNERTVVVIDPPRAGCDQRFLDQLFAFAPKRLVYVSCDPATQARDAQLIVAQGYVVLDVTPFDLFPQTRHIESVMTFAR